MVFIFRIQYFSTYHVPPFIMTIDFVSSSSSRFYINVDFRRACVCVSLSLLLFSSFKNQIG